MKKAYKHSVIEFMEVIMNLIEAIIMGIVQGIAEFLPISSSGHLAIFKHVLGVKTDTGMMFDIMLHFGTLVAIFIAFWKDIKELVVGGFSIIGRFFYNLYVFVIKVIKKDVEYKKIIKTDYDRFVMLIIVSTIPTGLAGVLLGDIFESIGESLLFTGMFLILTAVLLFIADRCKVGNTTMKDASYKKAGIIGVAQAIAISPGLSRSGTTITACLLCGFTKEFAVKYSFLMSIPAVLGAVVLDIPDLLSSGIETSLLTNYAIGTIVSCVVGYICIVTMLKIVRNKKFFGFTIYCAVVGTIAIVANFLV